MPATTDQIRQSLQRAFPDDQATIEDLKPGSNDYYKIKLASAAFVGLNRIQSHRLVTRALDEYGLHALTLELEPKQ